MWWIHEYKIICSVVLDGKNNKQTLIKSVSITNLVHVFFFFFLGPVCISSGSTSAFKAYCAFVQIRRETTQAISLQTVMWEVSVSDLAQDTNYPDRFFVGFITTLWKMKRGQIRLGHGILYLYQCHFPLIIQFFTSWVADRVTVFQKRRTSIRLSITGSCVDLFRPQFYNSSYNDQRWCPVLIRL
jgi:hypothetical protein